MRRDEPERLREEFAVVAQRLEALAEYTRDCGEELIDVDSEVHLASKQPQAVANKPPGWKPGAVKTFVEGSLQHLAEAQKMARLTKTVRGIEQVEEQLRTLRDHEALQVVVETGEHQ